MVARNLRVTRNLLAHRYFRSSIRLGDKLSFSSQDLEKINNYLENPTREGIWVLRFSNNGKGFPEEFNSIIAKAHAKKDGGYYSHRLRRSVVGTSGWSLTFLLSIFDELANGRKKVTRNSRGVYAAEENVLDTLSDKDKENLNSLKLRYKNSFDFFKKNVISGKYYSDYRLSKIKKGIFLSVDKGEDENDEYSGLQFKKYSYIVSLDSEVLECISDFFLSLGTIRDSKLYPVYSPEKEVFLPYFDLFNRSFRFLIDDEGANRLFSRAIEEYDDDNYSHAIGTIGLIAEDVLMQIYETFFRDVCPRSLGLGDLYKLIHRKIKDRNSPEIFPISKTNELYAKIKEKSDKTSLESSDVINVIRELLSCSHEKDLFLDRKIEFYQSGKQELSIFDRQLKQNIRELTTNRNAASHKTGVPIGKYEALRTIYCCFTLIQWWTREKNKINWKETSEEILNSTILRNSQLKPLKV
jgi:hypothetical protein